MALAPWLAAGGSNKKARMLRNRRNIGLVN